MARLLRSGNHRPHLSLRGGHRRSLKVRSRRYERDGGQGASLGNRKRQALDRHNSRTGHNCSDSRRWLLVFSAALYKTAGEAEALRKRFRLRTRCLRSNLPFPFNFPTRSLAFNPRIRAFSCTCEGPRARVVALTGGALTSQKPLKFEKNSRDHETIFLNHYDWLVDWAKQLTQGASEEADDLVQDLYVRFVQMTSGPDLSSDDQIRAYLYTSLKNLFISKKLRNGRDAISGLLAVDFDYVEFAMSAVDRSQLLHVRSDLAGICEYACIRRKTSRAAAALILRFFLGYLPTEVMALLRAQRST